MKDLYNVLHAAASIPPVTITADGATTGTGVDLLGYDSVIFTFQATPLVGATTVTPVLEESDSLASGYTVVSSDDLIGALADAVLTTATPGVPAKIGYKGSKQFVRLQLVVTGYVSDFILASVCLTGHPAKAPVPNLPGV